MSLRDRNRQRNLPPANFQELYDHVHTEFKDYGVSPFRAFEYVRNIQPLTFKSVLDVGCGSGQLLKWIKHTKPDVKCYGTDISQVALDKVDICDVALKQGTAQELPFPDDRADLVICTHVLDRIPEPDTQKALAHLKRVATGHIWIQVSDCDGTAEDKYVKDKIPSLLTTRRTIIWWETNIQKQKIQIIRKSQEGKTVSFLCYHKEGLIEYAQKHKVPHKNI